MSLKPAVRIKLQEPAFLTAEGSDRQSFGMTRLRAEPERFLRLPCVPPRHIQVPVRMVPHKTLDHLALAFGTLQSFVAHNRWSEKRTLPAERPTIRQTVRRKPSKLFPLSSRPCLGAPSRPRQYLAASNLQPATCNVARGRHGPLIAKRTGKIAPVCRPRLCR